jgi:hypothetical protein
MGRCKSLGSRRGGYYQGNRDGSHEGLLIYRFSDLSVWVCYWLVISKCLWGGEEGIGGVEGIKIMRFCWVSLNDKYSACWP